MSKGTRPLRKLGCKNIDFAGRFVPDKEKDKLLAETLKNSHPYYRYQPSSMTYPPPPIFPLQAPVVPIPAVPANMGFNSGWIADDNDHQQSWGAGFSALPPGPLPPLPSVPVTKKWIDLSREARTLSLRDFCDNSPFWTDNDINKCEVDLKQIPHLNMVMKDDGVVEPQFVFGRSGLLGAYRKCDKFFRVLSVGDWTLFFNDLFTYCASKSKINKFPIRIITSPTGGIGLKDTTQYGIRDYDSNLITSPLLLSRLGVGEVTSKIDITSRELCQLQQYFKMYFYQSLVDNSIFFASRFGPGQLVEELKLYRLKYIPRLVS
jgi:hypothetical protein